MRGIIELLGWTAILKERKQPRDVASNEGPRGLTLDKRRTLRVQGRRSRVVWQGLKPAARCGRSGFIWIEALVGISLMGLIAVLAARTASGYYRTRDYYFSRQAALWAADAQWQRYRAGAPISSPPPAGLVPKSITLETTLEPGSGQWQGFNRTTVVATATVPGSRQIQERISGYVHAEVRP